ncbi:4Fe-4S ferredoxin [candidate division WWE3 bacterium CG_4_8_14_3_um_filter_42_11]|uniref:4Fe-4S ferredoxin n=1 Tax=candidate division WWE3 bacterium CG_4_8_14_3_um_filter_42_11 TaxID=1975076 RepID=A0A2M8G5S2_UNCKA|nr:MAG: 4Fe-4S ferredoxin [candidate division WWE3 bacterium CG_4_8_14_3_um_filter_42_11]
MADNFAFWYSIERSQIDWHPIIDEEKCIGCGLCTTTCGRGVYKYDYENKKSKVVNPNLCMVACQTCANLCPVGAISFTKADELIREKAQKIVTKFEVLAKAKQELNEQKETLKYQFKKED